jgi:hypothetical protein
LLRYKDEEQPQSEGKSATLHTQGLVSPERERLLTEMMVVIRASHMFLTFEFHTAEFW